MIRTILQNIPWKQNLAMASQKTCVAAMAIVVLLLPALSSAQTATCAKWTYFRTSTTGRTIPEGINRWGTVVGYMINDNSPHSGASFIRWANGGVQFYQYPGSLSTTLGKRNVQGVTVGSWYDSSNHSHGLVLSGSTAVTIDHPGATDTRLGGINSWGSIVGQYTDTSGVDHAFELKDGKYIILVPQLNDPSPAAISDKAVIVGSYFNAGGPPNGDFQGFVLQSGQLQFLQDPNTRYDTYADDINGSGAIVGNYFPDPNPHGYLYINGVFKDIVAPNSDAESTTANAINGYGYVVGETSFKGVPYAYIAHCE